MSKKSLIVLVLGLALIGGAAYFAAGGQSLQGKFSIKSPTITNYLQGKTAGSGSSQIENISDEYSLLGAWDLTYKNRADGYCNGSFVFATDASPTSLTSYFEGGHLYVMPKGQTPNLPSDAYLTTTSFNFASNSLKLEAATDYSLYLYGDPIKGKSMSVKSVYMQTACAHVPSLVSGTADTFESWAAAESVDGELNPNHVNNAHFSLGTARMGLSGGVKVTLRDTILAKIVTDGSGSSELLDSSSGNYEKVGQWLISYQDGNSCPGLSFSTVQDTITDINKVFSDTRLYAGISDDEIADKVKRGHYFEPSASDIGTFSAGDFDAESGESVIVALYASAKGISNAAVGGEVFMNKVCGAELSGTEYVWSAKDSGYNKFFSVPSFDALGVSGGINAFSL